MCSTQLTMEDMYIELIRDNHEILDAMDDAEIQRIIELLKKNKRPEFMEILCFICVCNDLPEIKHQDRIVRLLLEQNTDLLYETRLINEDAGVEIRMSRRDEDWVSLRKCVFINGIDLL
jgi:hypothetical protein